MPAFYAPLISGRKTHSKTQVSLTLDYKLLMRYKLLSSILSFHFNYYPLILLISLNLMLVRGKLLQKLNKSCDKRS